MDFWELLARFSDVVGLAGAVFAGYAAFRLWQQNKRLRELARQAPAIENFTDLVKAHDGVKSSAPVALALSLLPSGESILPQVKTFLRARGWNMEIEELKMSGIHSPQDLAAFVNQLREKRRLFQAQANTEIHLFIAGPIQAGTIVGALYDNWIPVKLYHKPTPPPPDIYEYWMPLL